MRVLLLPIIAAALGAPSSPPLATPVTTMPVLNPLQARTDCPEAPMSLARKQAERPQAIPLDQLPDAMLFAAVDRRVGGCPAPLILSREPRWR